MKNISMLYYLLRTLLWTFCVIKINEDYTEDYILDDV